VQGVWGVPVSRRWSLLRFNYRPANPSCQLVWTWTCLWHSRFLGNNSIMCCLNLALCHFHLREWAGALTCATGCHRVRTCADLCGPVRWVCRVCSAKRCFGALFCHLVKVAGNVN